MATGQPSVADYVVERLSHLGIRYAFGVPGDYAFPLDDAIEEHASVEWIVSSNELNAAYAADGYARLRGAALLCTTYAVGELSALNGVMGSRAEHVPVFHLVGTPSLRLIRDRSVVHHSFGDGQFGQFAPLSAAAACVTASLTPENTIAEMERVISEALRCSQPAYVTVAEDVALMPVIGTPVTGAPVETLVPVASSAKELAAALDAVLSLLENATSATMLNTHTIARYRLQPEVLDLLEATAMPYATTRMDKAVLSEDHPQFVGIYEGANSHEWVRSTVEDADLVLDVGGVVLSDHNTGAWSHQLDRARLVTLARDHVVVGENTYGPVALRDMILGLTERALRRPAGPPEVLANPPVAGKPDDAVSSATFYPRLLAFLRERDMIFTDTGLSAGALTALRLPAHATLHYQTLWGSIGWATGAAFGASLAEPTRRTVLVTGDGAHQMTAGDIGAMGRYGATPVIFVLNNGVYGIEEILSQREGHIYDDLAPWNYVRLPEAMGCRGWFTASVETITDLDKALDGAAGHQGASYIEIVLDRNDLPPKSTAPVLDTLYKTQAADHTGS